MELLVVDGRLYLAHDLLGARARSVLDLGQLVNRGRIHMVDLTTITNNGSARILLSINYCLGLSLCLSLGSLQSKTTNLIH